MNFVFAHTFLPRRISRVRAAKALFYCAAVLLAVIFIYGAAHEPLLFLFGHHREHHHETCALCKLFKMPALVCLCLIEFIRWHLFLRRIVAHDKAAAIFRFVFPVALRAPPAG